jgi:hypothetical protein
MDQCIKAMGRYYMEREFGLLIDDQPFDANVNIRTRPNPKVHESAK